VVGARPSDPQPYSHDCGEDEFSEVHIHISA
jgi:hypothetical protein